MTVRLTFIVTHPVTADLLLRGQLRFLQERGLHVTVIASPGPELDRVRERESVDTIEVPMSRSVRLREGPRALGGVIQALRRARPDILNASTPKASLLGLIGGAVLRIPRRIYLVRGSRLETTRGAARAALAAAERICFASAHHAVFVSESLRLLYVGEGLVSPQRASVIPSNGVDVTRFIERARTREVALDTRRRLGIPGDALVCGFVGRFADDKGISDLVSAFDIARREVPLLRLLLVGGDVAGDVLDPWLTARLAGDPGIVLTGKLADVAPMYAAMDFLAFPSYREGLPNVPLEAAASEVPAIGYLTTGVRDAIAHGQTGTLVPYRDTRALAAQLIAYATSAELRARQGAAARQRVVSRFTQPAVWDAWAELYAGLK